MPGRQRGPKRHIMEREADRVFLFQLFQAAGPQFKTAAAIRILNERRVASARLIGEALEKTEAEILADEENAPLSQGLIYKEVQIVLENLRRGSAAGAALLLDGQVDEAQAEIAMLLNLDDQIQKDLEASRSRSWTRTTSRGVNGTNKQSETSHEETGAAQAALYARITANVNQRQHLRRELRELVFGRGLLPDVEEDSTAKSFAQVVTGEPTVGEARKACLAILAQEVDSLGRSEIMELGPATAESVRKERLRVQRSHQRIVLAEKVMGLVGEGEKDGGGAILEVEVIGRPAAVQ